MDTRRKFLKQFGALTAVASGMSAFNTLDAKVIKEKINEFDQTDPKTLARNEDFWYHVQKSFNPSPHFINLENGYFLMQPTEVLEAQIDNMRMINENTSFYYRRKMRDDRLEIKKKLAKLAGVSHEEIVITRNTTEALDTVILGMDLKDGDECLMCDQDYGSMLEAFEQRAQRYGVRNKVIEVPLWPKNKMEVVKTYERAITPNTKVILLTHLINLTGQIMPAREIADMAHERGIEVILDAAHSFAQIDFKIKDTDCDYMGTSLHKWLCCPLGAGMLYMKKEKIEKTWPLFGDSRIPKDDIRKFEHIGTHPENTRLSIAAAIDFHNSLGIKRKEARLRYLKNYWVDQVKDLPKITINTPLGDDQSCAIANFSVEGMTPNEVSEYLYENHKVWTVAINRKSVKGVRVTPHLYTRIEHLDALVKAIKELA